MEIKEWFLKGFVTITKESIYFKGIRYDVHGSKEIEYGYKLNSKVRYSFRQKQYNGTLIKINKTTAIVVGNNNQEVKVAISNIIIQNRYPNLIYRFQHKTSKKGPFQTDSTEYPQDVKYLLHENLNRVSSYYDRYKPPQLDKDLQHIFNRDFKFACHSQYQLENWFQEIIHCHEYFETVTLQEGWDYLESYSGDMQVIYKEIA